MRSFILVLTLVVLSFSTTFATAKNTSVEGTIYSTEGSFIQGASVYLMRLPADIMIKTAVSNASGKFELQVPSTGSYYIEVTAIGFNKFRSEEFVISDQDLNMDSIFLTPSAVEIAAVTVEGKLPQIQMIHGKTIMNVENSAIATGNNALEILTRAPGVSVDNNDNIQLMGRDGVNVMIDGRQTYMTNEQLASFLKATDGSQIKSVEISTTRSAREDAEGSAGVINIVLKKNRSEGFNGTFNATAGMGKKFRGNSSISLNYKTNGTNIFGSYSLENSRMENHLDILRIIRNGEEKTSFNQNSLLSSKENSHNYRIGIEQATSDRNIITAQFTGLTSTDYTDNTSVTDISQTSALIDSILDSRSDLKVPFDRYSFNLNNEFKIDTLGKKLTTDLDLSKFDNTRNINYLNHMQDGSGNQLEDPEIQRAHMPSRVDILATKIDYTQSVGKGILEAGLKYSNVKTDNNLSYENLLSDKWENDPNRSNHFIYREEIASIYTDYSTSLGKWGIKGGLRAEHTWSNGHSVTLNQKVPRTYLDVFPSANISYSGSENHIITASYAKKVSRPNYRRLNPFEYFLDKFTSEKGNPYLKPQYTNSFSLSYVFMKMFSATLGYDYTYDSMIESMGQDSVKNTTWIQMENLATQHLSYLNINAPFRIGNIWTMNNNFTFLRFFFEGPIAGDYISQGTFAFQGNSTHQFQLGKGFSSELTLKYMSPFIYNVYKLHRRWGTDIGFTKNLKDQRSSLKLSISDLFNTNSKINLTTDFGRFDSRINQTFDMRVIRLTYSYKFGNLKQSQKRKSVDTEEQSRAL